MSTKWGEHASHRGNQQHADTKASDGYEQRIPWYEDNEAKGKRGPELTASSVIAVLKSARSLTAVTTQY